MGIPDVPYLHRTVSVSLRVAEERTEELLGGEFPVLGHADHGIVLAEILDGAVRVADGHERLAIGNVADDGIAQDGPGEAPVERLVGRGDTGTVVEELLAVHPDVRQAVADGVDKGVVHGTADRGERLGARVLREAVKDGIEGLDPAPGLVLAVELHNRVHAGGVMVRGAVAGIGREHGDVLLLPAGGCVAPEADVVVHVLHLPAEQVHGTGGSDERAVLAVAAEKVLLVLGALGGRLLHELLERDAEHVAGHAVIGRLELAEAPVEVGVAVAEEVWLLRDCHRVHVILACLLRLGILGKDLLDTAPLGRKVWLVGTLDAVDLLADDLAEELNTAHDLCPARVVGTEDGRHRIEDGRGVGEAADAGAEAFVGGLRDVGDRHLLGFRCALLVGDDRVVLVGSLDEILIVRAEDDVPVEVGVLHSCRRRVISAENDAGIQMGEPAIGFPVPKKDLGGVVFMDIDHWRATNIYFYNISLFPVGGIHLVRSYHPDRVEAKGRLTLCDGVGNAELVVPADPYLAELRTLDALTDGLAHASLHE